METPHTDENRLNELNKNVQDYLAWINRTDSELTENIAPLRLKPVNQKMITEPVW